MYKKLIILSVSASALLFSANPSSAETLQETVKQALVSHPSIEAILAGKDAALEIKEEARSDYFPRLSAGTSVGQVYTNNSTSRGLTVTRGAADSGLWEADATITQPIFNGNQTKNRIEAAQARIESANYNVLDIRENLALRTVQAHISVLQAQETLNWTRSYFTSIDDYLKRIQYMVDEGVADESEVAQARNISLMLEGALTDYEGQVNTALANYSEVVGRYPHSALIKPALISTIGDMQTALVYAKANHPLLKQNEKEMEAIQHDIKAEAGGVYPNIDAELSGIKRDQKEEIGGELEDARALLKLSWDFETGGASKARQRRFGAQQSEIVAQNKEHVRIIEGDIRRAYTELDIAQKQVRLLKQREVVTKELSETYKTQFEGARVRLLQLMQVENQLFNVQLESISAEYRYIMAQYNVLASTGQLQKTILGEGTEIVKLDTFVSPVLKKDAVIIQAQEKSSESLTGAVVAPMQHEISVPPVRGTPQVVPRAVPRTVPNSAYDAKVLSPSSSVLGERTYITIK